MCTYYTKQMISDTQVITVRGYVGNPIIKMGMAWSQFCHAWPMPGPRFPTSYTVCRGLFYVFNNFRRDIIVCFVNIGGITYYLGLNVSFHGRWTVCSELKYIPNYNVFHIK